jgi:hypothetical protein
MRAAGCGTPFAAPANELYAKRLGSIKLHALLRGLKYPVNNLFNNEPNVPDGLMQLQHAVVEPHQGSGTFETRNGMGQLTLKNIACFVQGLPLVTPVV